MRLLLMLAAWLCCRQTVLAQENLDPHEIHDAVQINELVLVYLRADVEQNKTAHLEDAVDHHVAITAARLAPLTYDLIDFALGYATDLKFARAILDAPSPDNYTWTVEWNLLPAEGMSTGIPYRLRTHLTGKGRIIKPHAYLWDAYELTSGRFIRCALAMADCRVDSKKSRCHGDEVLKRATEALGRFTANELAKLKSHDSEVRIPDWRLHSLHLIDALPDNLRVWQVNFVDGSSPDISTTVTTCHASVSGLPRTAVLGNYRPDRNPWSDPASLRDEQHDAPKPAKWCFANGTIPARAG